MEGLNLHLLGLVLASTGGGREAGLMSDEEAATTTPRQRRRALRQRQLRPGVVRQWRLVKESSDLLDLLARDRRLTWEQGTNGDNNSSSIVQA